MRYLALLIVSCLFVGGTALSQNKMKFGHIDSQELLESMPEKVEADKALEAYANQLQKQLQTMSTEWEAKMADYRKNQAVMTDIIKQAKEEEISNLEQRIQNFQQNAQSSLAKKEGEVYQPILDKAREAIEAVAKENNFNYVFDSSSGSLLYQPESDDVLPLVKKKLGITDPPAAPAE